MNADNATAKQYRSYDHAQKQRDGYDFTIDYDGNWYYHSGALAGPIKREKLAALFGGAGHGFMAGKGLLIDEDGKYWLRSPDGQYGVDVEDVPFVIVDYSCDSNDDLVFVTNFDEQVFVRESGDVFLKEEPLRGEPVLYCHVRKGLVARVSRAVFASLIFDGMLDEAGTGYVLHCGTHGFTLGVLS